ncbi:hypothetical protein, variant [Aphanomyces invadans]|uniref:Methyltransferase small domain-containing protein n=1 Tax=Aphanomyces invadans TaxID=157072 RepID=A0A024U7X6_9STRA|nr:hypothetical protein, variant [Aphanomyces invadans]ETW02315.1 hypothetical protein, variant [Aphanomyces invadans]|eukprot:XP_008868920.1 hypothetical protein, variant [Aphanomyces invadans]
MAHNVVAEENAERKCEWRVTVDGVVLTQNFFGAAVNATGGALWDSSLVLWESLQCRRWHGQHVLELGSGVGFLAVKLAIQGAQVVATDGDADAMHLLRDNLKRNQVASQVRTAFLPWGDDAALQAAFPSTNGPPKFDHVVGADLIYNPDFHSPLVSTLRAVCSDTTVVHLSYRIRHEEKCVATST